MSIKPGDVVTFALRSEICCEVCNVVIHNYFACPACGMHDASADVYDGWCTRWDHNLACEECGALFEHIEGHPYDTAKWRLVSLLPREGQ